MKLIALTIAMIVSINCYAQKIMSYKASNGVNYEVGAKVKIGLGTGLNGKFVFLGSNGIWNGDVDALAGPKYANNELLIKRITTRFEGGHDQMVFIVESGGLFNYQLDIEHAIQTCEVVPCKAQATRYFSVADEILKLKKLLDTGILTQSEFDEQKKKLLAN